MFFIIDWQQIFILNSRIYAKRITFKCMRIKDLLEMKFMSSFSLLKSFFSSPPHVFLFLTLTPAEWNAGGWEEEKRFFFGEKSNFEICRCFIIINKILLPSILFFLILYQRRQNKIQELSAISFFSFFPWKGVNFEIRQCFTIINKIFLL